MPIISGRDRGAKIVHDSEKTDVIDSAVRASREQFDRSFMTVTQYQAITILQRLNEARRRSDGELRAMLAFFR